MQLSSNLINYLLALVKFQPQRENLAMRSEKNKKISVLLISLPGVLQNVLRQTLRARLDVVLVGVASGCLSALSMIKAQAPDLVVIDSNMPEAEIQELFLRMKAEQVKSRSLVLTETSHQKEFAKTAGADFVLRSDTLSRDLDFILTETRNGSKVKA
jgi:DNA-binding NarL/FixJ family response regulator